MGCFVSSITSCMAGVWNATRTTQLEFLLLKKYLNQNKVSWTLTSRITRYTEYVLQQRNKRVHEGKVQFLSLLSKPLHVELQKELFLPQLKKMRIIRSLRRHERGCHE